MIAFRLDFDEIVGGGHLQRCLALAENFPEKEVFLFVRGEVKTKYRQIKIPKDLSLAKESAFIGENVKEKFRAVFFDIANARTYKQAEAVQDYFSGMKDVSGVQVLIDGFGEDSILGRVSGLSVDFVVTPYVGAQKENGNFQHLYGPDYFIVPKVKSETCSVEKKVERVLVTMGRSDADGASLKMARLVAEEIPEVKVSVVVGDLFPSAIKNELQELGRRSDRVTLLEGKTELYSLFAANDFVITGSGLTKYELAFSGVPCAFLATNATMGKINAVFASAGTGLDLGVLDGASSKRMGAALRTVLADFAKRKKMAETGRKLIDGKGAERLLKRVLGAAA